MTNLFRNPPFTRHLAILQNFHSQLVGHSQAEFSQWVEKDKVKFAIEHLRLIEVIPTIYQKEQPEKLRLYYYPSEVYKKSEKKKLYKNVDLYNDFSTDKAVIIEGTVGQGKSILLRHLHIAELNKGTTIPIFIELKDIKNEIDLYEYICSTIEKNLKLRCSLSLFNCLLNKGVFSFFLDGFDEIEHIYRNYLVKAISRLIIGNTSNKTFITSRPGNEIQQAPNIEIYTIKPLIKEDQIKFVKKLLTYKNSQYHKKNLLTNLEAMDDNLRSLLTTPLILTLFTMVYRTQSKIPDSYSAFYKRLFETLVSEHDGLKLGFIRPTRSQLSADEIKTILEHLSFKTIQLGITEFELDEFSRYINGVLKSIKNTKTSAQYIIEDLTKNTCLIQCDDLKYKFLHRSIPSYFAASCISNNASDESTKNFYTGARKIDKWEKWNDVLEFLKNIDKVRFNKYFQKQELEFLLDKTKLTNKFLFTKNASKELSKNILIGFRYERRENEAEKDLSYQTKGSVIMMWIPSSAWVFSKYFSEYSNHKFVNLNDLFKAVIKRTEELKTEELNKFVFGDRNSNVYEHDNKFLSPVNFVDFLDKFKLNEYFFTEVNRLNLQPISDEYYKVIADCKMLEEHENNGVYDA